MLWLPVTAVVLAHLALLLRVHGQSQALSKELRARQDELKAVAEERRKERVGRTKAEVEARQAQLRLAQLEAGLLPEGTSAQGPAVPTADADLLRVPFPLRPIGLLRSVFNRRNGTPRQPLLVPAARAELTLRPDLGPEFLEGLERYSHCWLLYIFHANTDLQRLWKAGQRGSQGSAKIRVPRLDGARMGALATRSPHRPCPVGLSVARVLGVCGRTLLLGGADVVDGSPVLDVKPYVPFCDALPAATAPPWVAASAEGGAEPLEIAQVVLPEAAEAALRRAWSRRGKKSLYRESFEAYRQLLVEVLSRDIRSVTQRVKAPSRERVGRAALGLQAAPAADGGAGGGDAEGGGQAAEGKWHVMLDGVDVSYEVDEQRRVVVRTAVVPRPGGGGAAPGPEPSE